MEKEYQCRVCLSDSQRKYVSLFKKHKGTKIFTNINSITNLDINKADGLPGKICSHCLTELEAAVSFRDKCVESNTILLNALTHSVKLEDDNTDKFVDDIKGSSVHPVKREINSAAVPPVGKYDNLLIKTDCPLPEKRDCLSPVKSEPVDDYSEAPEEDFHYFEDNAEEKVSLNQVDLGLRKSRAVNLQLQCDDCGQLFKSKCKLRVHWKKVHLPQKLLCMLCKRQFKSIKAFNRHQKDKTKNCISAKNFNIEGVGSNRVFYCKECSYKTRRIIDMITHTVIHTGDRPFKCDMCPTTYTQQGPLISHKESAHGIVKYEITCQYCGLSLQGRHKIYSHLKRHAEKPVQCPVCQKPLKNQFTLRDHMRRHSGQKQYSCEKCSRSFYTAAELSNHKNIRHKNIYVKCNKCEYKARRRETMKKHEVKHTTNNIPCTICGIFVEDAQALILHQRRHFEDKKYPCPYCGLKFMRKDTVPRHVRAKHPDVGKPAASVLVKKEKAFENSNVFSETDYRGKAASSDLA